MAQDELLYRIVVKDDGTAVLEKFSQNVGDTGKKASSAFDSLSSAGTKLFGAMTAIVGVLYTLKKAYDFTIGSASQAEQVTKSLSNALMNQGVYAKSVTQDLAKYATNLSMITGYSDEAIISMQALLATYGVTADKLKEATRVSLDFAAATGTDLNAAALLVGKSSQGMTETLTRYGIVVDANGSKTEKFAQVMKKMNDQFGGRAAGDVDTFAGRLRKVADSIGEIGEQLGTTLVKSTVFAEMMDNMNVTLRALSVAMEKNREEGDKGTKGWLSHLAAMTPVGFVYQNTVGSVKNFTASVAEVDKKMKNASVSAKAMTDAAATAAEKLKQYKDQPWITYGFKPLEAKPDFSKGPELDWNKEEQRWEKSKAFAEWEKRNLEDKEALKDIALEREKLRVEEYNRFQEEAQAMIESRRSSDMAAFENHQAQAERTIELEQRKTAVIMESVSMLGVAAQLASVYAAKNFALQKSFAIAEAAISGALAVQKALASGPGGPWGIAMAAIIAAKAAANIALIAGTKPGGAGGGGGGGAGGGLGGAGGGFPAVPETPARAVPNVNISVSGFVGDEAKLASELGRVVREAVGDGVSFGLQASTS